MSRMLLRVGVVLGLALLVLVLAASVLAVPFNGGGAVAPIEAGIKPQAVSSAPDFTLATSTVIASGLNQPVGISNAGDGSGRLFVVEQAGYIRVIRNGALLNTPYLTLTSKVLCCGERGLLSVAFDPSYKTNGIFYVYYTALNGDVTIERYVATNPASDEANISSSTLILTVTHPEINHNGGQLQFGLDGYLYAGLGDGGGGGDQHGTIGNGQNPAALLGKILRLNVRDVPTYTVPASNPFTRTVGYRPEIWALGVRNPWRFSFDHQTGDLYIGDVGQNCWEEIDFQPAGSHGGENYGWRIMEGFHPFNVSNFSDCSQPPITPPTITLPITAYGHDLGLAVTGGYVYRGAQYPWLRGVYFYSDSYSGRIWAVQQTSPGIWSGSQKLSSGLGVTAFGADESGELYVTDYNQGRIFKITSPSPINFSTSSKTASASQVITGSTVTYTIVLRNTGVPFYDTVRVTDTVPAGLSYVAGSLSASSGAIDAAAAPTLKWSGTMSTAPTSIVTITYQALVTASSLQSITNTATIAPALNPPFTRSATVTVIASGPDLSGSTKQASAVSVRWNNTLTYTIVLRNSGPAFTQMVRVTDTLPAGLSYVPGTLTATHGTPDDSAAPTLKWNGVMSAMPAITVTFAALATTPNATSIVNTATINSGYGLPFARTALIVVNPYEFFLPLLWRNN